MSEVVRPSGTVTFLFTDVEGSTALWGSAPEAMGEALALHDRVLRGVFEDHGGFVFATGGDGLAVAFGRVQDGVEAAVAAQEALGSAAWPEGAALKVRMGLHVGEVEERDGDYFGPAVNRAARIMDAGHGGQTLASTPVVEIAGGDGWVPLGHHRLRGFGSPDELWQLGGGSFPPLRSLRQAGNLPQSLSSFVGRQDELADVTATLGAARLVTLVGVGGVGKTRLAVEAAHGLAGGFADGVWFVDLAPRGDPEGLVEAVAAAVGVAPQAGESILASLLGYLAERRTLLVLDNCEHLLDAVASLCSEILAEAEGVTVLATSREPVGIRGERILAMPSLAQGSELFVERATESQTRFDPSAEDLDVIETICGRLDGIPLAIELAAARTRSMTVEEISDALDDRFRLLRGSGRGGTERHQTLQATVQWSLDLLDDSEQRLFDHLSVFPADFDLAAVEAICGPLLGADMWDLRDGLDRLVERSLLVADQESGVTRFRLLETFRQFGEQSLEPDVSTALRRAHLRHFLEIAWQAGVGFMDRVKDPDADPWEIEWDNIRVAMQWAITDEDHQACARLARAANDYTLWSIDLEIAEWAIEAAAHPHADATTVAFASTSMGLQARGDYTAALDLARRAVAVDSSSPWPWCSVASAAYVLEGHAQESADAATKALDLLPAEAAAWRAGCHGLAAFALTSIDPVAASGHAEQIEALLATGMAPRAEVVAWNVLGLYSLGSGDLDGAIEHCEQALARITAETRGQVWVGANRVLAEATALKPGADAAPGFLRACERAGEMGWWGTLWRVLVPLARWWSNTGKSEPAALIAGCAAANGIQVAGLDELVAELADPAAAPALERGRQMDRSDMLDHVIAQLAPVAIGGHLDAPTESDEPGLTDRQQEVAQLVARGLTNKDIAKRLDISAYTVETHVRNILERLDATNRTQIVAWVMAQTTRP